MSQSPPEPHPEPQPEPRPQPGPAPSTGSTQNPGPAPRDPKAELHSALPGAARTPVPRQVLVVGGGIAGLAAATGLAERGVDVVLAEPEEHLGGRVRSWTEQTEHGPVSMGRGFHAFFRQYYNLRQLLHRLPAEAPGLRAVPDYPLVAANGLEDSFRRIPRVPPWSFIGFVLRSPSFRLRDLPRVDVQAALSLLDVDFPQTFRDYDGVSAQRFLDGLGFPHRARHLALEVFARSFFADPREFSAGELVAMFHTYFLGSAEGLLFDTAADDFQTALWGPLGERLERMGVRLVRARVTRLSFEEEAVRAEFEPADGAADASVPGEYDAVVLAAGPEQMRCLALNARGLGARGLGKGGSDPEAEAPAGTTPPGPAAVRAWRESMDRLRVAPPFAVWRLWLDRPVDLERPAFLGTAGFGRLDNISVLERFEASAARWREEHGGSVVELHAYALPEPERADDNQDEPREEAAVFSAEEQDRLREHLWEQLVRVWPEVAAASIRSERLLIQRDCPLIDTTPWAERPGVATPDDRLVLAGDCLRTDWPVALMERAATTGWQAANRLLEGWGVQGQDLYSPPTTARACAACRAWPGSAAVPAG